MTTTMPLPVPRGPLSHHLRQVLLTAPGESVLVVEDPHLEELAGTAARVLATADVLTDDDVQLSLAMLYELHYRGLTGVAADWEWSPPLLAVRARLEAGFEQALRKAVEVAEVDPAEVPEALFAMAAQDGGPGLARYLARDATVAQVREFLVHRSIYHLKEADPHTWAIPRLAGPVKAALVEIQADEYGGGRPERMHAALFARTMRALGLNDTYGAFIDRVPGVTLATVNAISLFGLHRRLVGATAGHLAMFEMTSSLPNKLYGNALRRLGFDRDATWFFDEHVEADAVHEQIAGRDLAGGLARADPDRTPDILFGAAAALTLDAAAATRVLGCWRAGSSSLRPAGTST